MSNLGGPVKGWLDLDRALEALAHAKTVEQLHQAQAVVLPLAYGLSMEQTALVLCGLGQYAA